jgi:hypothetical protein
MGSVCIWPTKHLHVGWAHEFVKPVWTVSRPCGTLSPGSQIQIPHLAEEIPRGHNTAKTQNSDCRSRDQDTEEKLVSLQVSSLGCSQVKQIELNKWKESQSVGAQKTTCGLMYAKLESWGRERKNNWRKSTENFLDMIKTKSRQALVQRQPGQKVRQTPSQPTAWCAGACLSSQLYGRTTIQPT